jgi:hypothetical protein
MRQNTLFKLAVLRKRTPLAAITSATTRINLRTGENERISVGLEQGEKEMALVKPGEKINKGYGEHRGFDNSIAIKPAHHQRVAKQLTG